MMPGFLSQDGLTHEQFIALIAIEQNEPPHRVCAESSAYAQMFAERLDIAIRAA